jgi:hypothetical protein
MLGPRLNPKPGPKGGISEKAARQSRGIFHGDQKTRSFMLYNLWQGTDWSAYNRESMSKSFYHAHWQLLN